MDERTRASRPNSRTWEITVYLPSKKMKEEWQEHAENHMMSASKFIMHAVDSYIMQITKERSGIRRHEIARMLEELNKENEELKEENHNLKLLSRGLEKELARVKMNVEPQSPIRKPDRKLIYALKKRGSLSREEILEVLGIEFVADEKMIASINSDLEALEDVGVVTFDGKRWRWNLG